MQFEELREAVEAEEAKIHQIRMRLGGITSSLAGIRARFRELDREEAFDPKERNRLARIRAGQRTALTDILDALNRAELARTHWLSKL